MAGAHALLRRVHVGGCHRVSPAVLPAQLLPHGAHRLLLRDPVPPPVALAVGAPLLYTDRESNRHCSRRAPALRAPQPHPFARADAVAPVYVIWNSSLVLTSALKIVSGRVGKWHVTKRPVGSGGAGLTKVPTWLAFDRLGTYRCVCRAAPTMPLRPQFTSGVLSSPLGAWAVQVQPAARGRDAGQQAAFAGATPLVLEPGALAARCWSRLYPSGGKRGLEVRQTRWE